MRQTLEACDDSFCLPLHHPLQFPGSSIGQLASKAFIHKASFGRQFLSAALSCDPSRKRSQPHASLGQGPPSTSLSPLGWACLLYPGHGFLARTLTLPFLQITAHILKQVVLPAAQKTEESLGSSHPSGTVELLGATSGEASQDTHMEKPAQLSCSVKEEPDADGQEMAPSNPPNPAQSREGHPGHREPASTSFHPPRIQSDGTVGNSWVGRPHPPAPPDLQPTAFQLWLHVAVFSLCLDLQWFGYQPPRRRHGLSRGQGPCVRGQRVEEASTQVSAPPCDLNHLFSGDESESHCEGPPHCPEAQPPRGPGSVTWEGPSGASVSARAMLEAELEPGAPRRKPYTCELCGRGFDWKSVFVIHHRMHADGQGTRAPVLATGGAQKLPQGSREPGTPRHPRRVLPGPRSYACEECGRSFSWKSQLVIHRKSHAGQRRHFCGDCGRGFDWKSQLVMHRKSHRPEAP
ncbi:hypothetical protein GH733_019697 [Mirounga leonina]|nr:hypothetical protein GH733_019697 [Mirounga leonina]